MSIAILNQYKIEFQNITKSFSGFPNTIDKRTSSLSVTLDIFLYGWDVDQINDSLLPDINNVLNGSVIEDETQSETIWVELKSNETKLFEMSKNSYIPDFTLPTSDFKEIVTAWRDFLLRPPFDGTKV